jgi:hypothetical protein
VQCSRVDSSGPQEPLEVIKRMTIKDKRIRTDDLGPSIRDRASAPASSPVHRTDRRQKNTSREDSEEELHIWIIVF